MPLRLAAHHLPAADSPRGMKSTLKRELRQVSGKTTQLREFKLQRLSENSISENVFTNPATQRAIFQE